MSLSIGEVVERSGVGHDTLRYWEREGLVPPPVRNAGGHRRYETSVLDVLGVITTLRGCGFSVEQVRHFLTAKQPGATRAQRVRAAEARLDELSVALDAQAAHLRRARTLVRQWRQDLAGVALDE